MRIKYEFRALIETLVKEAVDTYNFADAIEETIRYMNFESIVHEQIDSMDFEPLIEDAVNEIVSDILEYSTVIEDKIAEEIGE